MVTMKIHFILYVSNQERSTVFYSEVLDKAPTLNVPGMTEFRLADGTVLGLMPEAGIVNLLGPAILDPALVRGVPRAEVYLVVDDPTAFYARAIAAGAHELSRLALRDCGHRAAYCLDPDGHVLAFATAAD